MKTKFHLIELEHNENPPDEAFAAHFRLAALLALRECGGLTQMQCSSAQARLFPGRQLR